MGEQQAEWRCLTCGSTYEPSQETWTVPAIPGFIRWVSMCSHRFKTNDEALNLWAEQLEKNAEEAALRRVKEEIFKILDEYAGEYQAGGRREQFYQAHIRNAWRQCAHRIGRVLGMPECEVKDG